MSIQIEKNIPITGKKAGAVKYPTAQLEVGDSFLVPAGSVSVAGAYSVAVIANKKLAPKSFIFRKVEGGHRVWRIS